MGNYFSPPPFTISLLLSPDCLSPKPVGLGENAEQMRTLSWREVGVEPRWCLKVRLAGSRNLRGQCRAQASEPSQSWALKAFFSLSFSLSKLLAEKGRRGQWELEIGSAPIGSFQNLLQKNIVITNRLCFHGNKNTLEGKSVAGVRKSIWFIKTTFLFFTKTLKWL